MRVTEGFMGRRKVVQLVTFGDSNDYLRKIIYLLTMRSYHRL